MNTTTAAARTIRTALKREGWTSKDVSVRSSSFIDGVIQITIKTTDVNPGKVREIAKPFESIDRCSATGEILNGGNTFVRVEFERGVLEAYAAPVIEALEAGEAIEWGGFECRPVTNRPGYFCAVRLDAPRPRAHEVYCFGAEFCARQVADRVLAAA